ncbi:MAG: hypothetical protein N2749_05585 [Clostridia bacterium]|nr:hypothetical protein [Clostridia bacterium]
MKKCKLIIFLFSLMLCVTSFSYATNTTTNTTTTTTTRQSIKDKIQSIKDNKQKAIQIRQTIKENSKELARLRMKLRDDLVTIRKDIKSYKDTKKTLTAEQKNEIKSKLSILKQIRKDTLASYASLSESVRDYRLDNTDDRVTTLTKIAELQEARMTILEKAINDIESNPILK